MNPTNEQELDELLSELRSGTINFDYEAKQAIIDWHNKQVEEMLDRLDKHINWNKHDMGELGKFIRTVYAHNAIQAERALIEKRMM